MFGRKPKPPIGTFTHADVHAAMDEAVLEVLISTQTDIDTAKRLRTAEILDQMEFLTNQLSKNGAVREAAGIANAILSVELKFPWEPNDHRPQSSTPSL